MPSLRPKYQIYHTSKTSAVVMLKSKCFNDFQEKMDSEAKTIILLLSNWICFFVTQNLISNQFFLTAEIFKRPKPSAIQKHIYKHVEHHGKLLFLGVKVDKKKKKNPVNQKEAKFGNFWGLRAPLQKKLNYIPNFFADPG